MFHEYTNSVTARSAIEEGHNCGNKIRNIFHEIGKRKSNAAACCPVKLRKKESNKVPIRKQNLKLTKLLGENFKHIMEERNC